MEVHKQMKVKKNMKIIRSLITANNSYSYFKEDFKILKENTLVNLFYINHKSWCETKKTYKSLFKIDEKSLLLFGLVSAYVTDLMIYS